MVIAAYGFLLRTPQVEVACVLLLVAAHACFHVFLFTGKPGFDEQEMYAFYTTVVAIFTLFGGYLWERYLRRIQGGWHWEHVSLVSLPYLAGAVMFTTLMTQRLPSVFAPVAQTAFGVALMVVASVALLAGLRAGCLVALAFGAVNFYRGIYTYDTSIVRDPDFIYALPLIVGLFGLAERLVAWWKLEAYEMKFADRAMRSILVATGAVLGTMGLWEWAPEAYLTLFWLGLAIAYMATGVALRESRYRWTAIIVYCVAILRAYFYDLTNLNPLYQFLSFLALCVPLLVISRGYSRYRVRRLDEARDEQPDSGPSHGSAA